MRLLLCLTRSLSTRLWPRRCLTPLHQAPAATGPPHGQSLQHPGTSLRPSCVTWEAATLGLGAARGPPRGRLATRSARRLRSRPTPLQSACRVVTHVSLWGLTRRHYKRPRDHTPWVCRISPREASPSTKLRTAAWRTCHRKCSPHRDRRPVDTSMARTAVTCDASKPVTCHLAAPETGTAAVTTSTPQTRGLRLSNP